MLLLRLQLWRTNERGTAVGGAGVGFLNLTDIDDLIVTGKVGCTFEIGSEAGSFAKPKTKSAST